MQRIISLFLLLILPVMALADGMVVPTVAYPAKVTIPEQRALICFSNGIERLVIETRFTGAGRNFAWVVPLPSQPVIEEATTGLFPTLQYLFRPEIVHEVPRYYIGILFGLGLIYLLRLAAKSVWNAFVIAFFVLVLAAMLLPALGGARSSAMSSTSSSQPVDILDRELVGIYETTTITSRDSRVLENWLRDNGFVIAPDAKPVIDDYVKDGWVFVAAKIRRDRPDGEISTPHPLSFTFKTDKPVYPMRLTGLNSQSLSVDLYVFGNDRATAPHFKMESCTRPKLVHPLLRQWAGDSAVATKLTATLSPADMRQDVWLDQSSFLVEHKSRLFSRHGAWTVALNWGTGFFAIGLMTVCLSAFIDETPKSKISQRVGMVILIGISLVGLVYVSLPKIEVKLVKGRLYDQTKMELFAVRIALDDMEWHSTADVRAGIQKIISNPNSATDYSLKNWDNPFVGGQFREEDSPGNYLLRETNNQLQILTFNRDGAEEVQDTLDLPLRH
jgi:hypothetical protein